MPGNLDETLLGVMRCPRDFSELRAEGDGLRCAEGHRYPVIDGIPVMLLPEAKETLWVARTSAEAVAHPEWAPLYLETIGFSDADRRAIATGAAAGDGIDPVISHLVGATSGHGYRHLIGRLSRYPIPDIPLPPGEGKPLLDVGSSWGRWSVAAARKGWRVTAIDPSLGALLAAKRAFGGERPDIRFVCGDARHLPFSAGSFGAVYSYSVLQHFSEEDAETAIADMGRVLGQGGFARIQMAHGGIRYALWTPRRNRGDFRVRFWPLSRLRQVFGRNIGQAEIRAEAFGGLGLLREDAGIVSPAARMLVGASTVLKSLSRAAPALNRLADSVFVTAIKD